MSAIPTAMSLNAAERYARAGAAIRLPDWTSETEGITFPWLTFTAATSDLFTLTGHAFTAATTDICTSVAHGFVTGDLVGVSNSGGALPAGLSAGTDNFIIKLTADTFKLAASFAAAMAGTPIDITSTGSGTHTITPKHGFAQGQRVRFNTTNTLPGGIPDVPFVFVLPVSSTTFKICADPECTTVLDITDTGTGAHSVQRYEPRAWLFIAQRLWWLASSDGAPRLVKPGDLTAVDLARDDWTTLSEACFQALNDGQSMLPIFEASTDCGGGAVMSVETASQPDIILPDSGMVPVITDPVVTADPGEMGTFGGGGGAGTVPSLSGGSPGGGASGGGSADSGTGSGGSGGSGGAGGGGGGGDTPLEEQLCAEQTCASGRHWDFDQCKCVDDTDSEGDDLILHSSSSVLGRMVTLPGHAAMAMFGGTLMLAPVASRKKAREYFLVKVYGRSANTVIGSSTFFSGWMKPNTTQEWVKGLGLYSPTSDSVNVFVSATVNDGGTIRASQQGQPHAISLNV